MTVRSRSKQIIPHAVFYDENCFFCQRCVAFLLKIDKRQMFVFGPLGGKAAKEILSPKLPNYHELNTIVLVENFLQLQDKISIRSKAVLQILWIIGGVWKALGVFKFLPKCLIDPLYISIANKRRKLYKTPKDPKTKENKFRFLP